MVTDEFLERILVQVRRVLGAGIPVDYETDLVDIADIDSLSLIELVDKLDDEFSITIPSALITSENFITVREIGRTIQSLMDGE